MGTPRFTPEFKEEAVRQITERGYSVAEVSGRLGVSTHSLYKLLRAIRPDNNEQHARDLLEAKIEILKLRAQLKCTEEERDILKKAARYYAREHVISLRMAFMWLKLTGPNRSKRSLEGKSDPLDAENAARTVLSGSSKAIPKMQSGACEALRIISVARRSAVKARTQAINQLRALLVSAPQDVRDKLWNPRWGYCRYADDFVLIVKGTKSQAGAIREECRSVLEDSLKLRLNMDKTRITHVNDGFNFLGHRIIRKRSRYGDMRVVTTIPRDKARNFAASLTTLLSSNYSENKIDMVGQLNRKLRFWDAFYQFVDFKAKIFSYIDRVVFWKLADRLAR